MSQHSDSDQLAEKYQPSGAWRRFFARFLDISIYGLVITMLISLSITQTVSIFSPSTYANIILSVIGIILLSLINIVIYSIFGNTLGKALLRVKVLDNSYNPISLSLYIKREFLFILKGSYLGIPILNFIAWVLQYGKVSDDGKTSYDKELGTQVYTEQAHWLKKTIYVILYIMLLVLSSTLLQVLMNNTHHG